jgi:hypothetical protein
MEEIVGTITPHARVGLGVRRWNDSKMRERSMNMRNRCFECVRTMCAILALLHKPLPICFFPVLIASRVLFDQIFLLIDAF